MEPRFICLQMQTVFNSLFKGVRLFLCLSSPPPPPTPHHLCVCGGGGGGGAGGGAWFFFFFTSDRLDSPPWNFTDDRRKGSK